MSCAFMAINMVIAAFVIGNVTILMTRADVALLAYRDDAQVIIPSRAVSCGTPERRVVLCCVVLCCVVPVSCAGTRGLASFASCHSLGRLVLCGASVVGWHASARLVRVVPLVALGFRAIEQK